jgi:uncharacterized membrane protein
VIGSIGSGCGVASIVILGTESGTSKRRCEMETRRETTFPFVGGGVGIGAALGLLFGLLLSDDMPIVLIAGAAIGLVVGSLVDRIQASRAE